MPVADPIDKGPVLRGDEVKAHVCTRVSAFVQKERETTPPSVPVRKIVHDALVELLLHELKVEPKVDGSVESYWEVSALNDYLTRRCGELRDAVLQYEQLLAYVSGESFTRDLANTCRRYRVELDEVRSKVLEKLWKDGRPIILSEQQRPFLARAYARKVAVNLFHDQYCWNARLTSLDEAAVAETPDRDRQGGNLAKLAERDQLLDMNRLFTEVFAGLYQARSQNVYLYAKDKVLSDLPECEDVFRAIEGAADATPARAEGEALSTAERQGRLRAMQRLRKALVTHSAWIRGLLQRSKRKPGSEPQAKDKDSAR